MQRIADLLVADGMAEYEPDPKPRRAKPLQPTAAGYAAVAASTLRTPFQARRLAERLGRKELSATLAALVRLASTLDALV